MTEDKIQWRTIKWPPKTANYKRLLDILQGAAFSSGATRNAYDLSKIVKVDMLDNPNMMRRFALACHLMSSSRSGIPQKQKEYGAGSEATPHRVAILAHLEKLIKLGAEHAGSMCPILPMFHGVRSNMVLESIEVNGGINMTDPTSVDPGYFGNGLYLTDCLEYAQGYADGTYTTKTPPYGPQGSHAVLFCAVAAGLVYPMTADKDDDPGNPTAVPPLPPRPSRYYGKPLAAAVDSHLIPVAQHAHNFAKIADPHTAHAYELVVRESSAVLPVAVLWVKR